MIDSRTARNGNPKKKITFYSLSQGACLDDGGEREKEIYVRAEGRI
jgi:hypothetical protein